MRTRNGAVSSRTAWRCGVVQPMATTIVGFVNVCVSPADPVHRVRGVEPTPVAATGARRHRRSGPNWSSVDDDGAHGVAVLRNEPSATSKYRSGRSTSKEPGFERSNAGLLGLTDSERQGSRYVLDLTPMLFARADSS